MASSPGIAQHLTPPIDTDYLDSEYGWDFDQDEEEALEAALSLIEAAAIHPVGNEIADEDAPSIAPGTAIVPRLANKQGIWTPNLASQMQTRRFREQSVEIEYDEPSRTAFTSMSRVDFGEGMHLADC
jgi:hypothetical protein